MKKLITLISLTLMLTGGGISAANYAGATGGGPPPPNPNQVEYWCVAPDSTGGIKVENVNALTFTVPAAPAGKVWTLLILKAGDEHSTPVVNEVFPDPVVGQTYERLTDDKNISHAILCYAPFTDPCAEGGAEFPCDPCEDAEEGEICPPCEQGDEREVCQPSCEELENCPEIPCEQTREGCPTTTTTSTIPVTVPFPNCTPLCAGQFSEPTTTTTTSTLPPTTVTTPTTVPEPPTTVPETVPPTPAPVAPPAEELPHTGTSGTIFALGLTLLALGLVVKAGMLIYNRRSTV